MDLSARGKKRRCLECQEAFYDLNRDPAPCPHCGRAHPLEAFTVSKRPAQTPAAKPKAAVVTPKPEANDDVDLEDEDDDDAVLGVDDDDLDDDDDAVVVKVVASDDKDDD